MKMKRLIVREWDGSIKGISNPKKIKFWKKLCKQYSGSYAPKLIKEEK